MEKPKTNLKISIEIDIKRFSLVLHYVRYGSKRVHKYTNILQIKTIDYFCR